MAAAVTRSAALVTKAKGPSRPRKAAEAKNAGLKQITPARTKHRLLDAVVVHGTSVPILQFRTEALIAQVGSVTAVAELLGVAKSQPTRWRKGEAVPAPDKARLLTDLEHVFSRASLIFEQTVINDWMTGSNSYLDGARPIDVLRTRGAAEVLSALDAAEQVAFG